MAVYKDKNGKWFVSVRYEDWRGLPARKLKRGFTTKKEAAEWENEFLTKNAGNLSMTFDAFFNIYKNNMMQRVKLNTWLTKESIVTKHISPYFGKKRMCDISVRDVMIWQNTMLAYRNEEGEPFSPGYLKTMHNQLSAIFNHAVKFYELKSNPAAKAGNMGKEKTREMKFWTKDEYLKFSEEIMDKPMSYYAFEVLYWCGLRVGELLALTSRDIDLKKKVIRINKSYQRINQEDIITEPKTPKSNRTVLIPDFLCEELEEYMDSIYGLKPNDRLFPVTKSYMHYEIKRGAKKAGLKQIRVHDIRHSHVSLLIEMGFSAVAIADRVGHESIDITFRYAHLFPTTQNSIVDKLEIERG